MTIVRQPSVSFSLVSADVEVANAPQRVLLIGQMLSGSATPGVYETNLPSDGTENARYGRTSMMAAMVRMFKKIAPQVQVDAVPLADQGVVFRIVTIGVTGSATENGEFVVTAGSDLLHQFKVAVTSGDANTTVIANIVAAINADLDCPFTAAANALDFTLTADNAGAVSNDLGIGVSGVVAGIAIGTVTDTTPGATNPLLSALQAALDAVGGDRHQAIVWPYSEETEAATEHLDARFNVTNNVLDGVAFTTNHDTHANQLTELATAEKNSQSLVFICDERNIQTGYIGPAQNEASYLKSTMFAAIRGLRLTPDEAISQFVTTSAAADQFGGAALASLPYFNTPLPHLPSVRQGLGYTEVEIEQLHDAGGAVFGVNPAGSASIAGEIPTTYLTDPAGNSDITWQYLNYVDTASGAREYFHNNVRKRFAQSRLTTGRVIAGRSMANALTIKGYLVLLYNDLSGVDFTLVEGGEEQIKFFKDNVTVTIDLADGKATITMKLPIVTQLRTIIATVKIVFSATS